MIPAPTCLLLFLVHGNALPSFAGCEDRRCVQMTEPAWRAERERPGFVERFQFKAVARGVACVVRKGRRP